MIELIATIGVSAGSVLLFGYWFRYTCLLILNTKTARDYAGEVIMANQLSFLEVQSQLQRQAPAELDGLQMALDRDYAIVTYLLKRAMNGGPGLVALETRMLKIDYRLMRAWYRVSRSVSVGAAREALKQMSLVVAHFADSVGECNAAASAA
jgi:hypothetical protein